MRRGEGPVRAVAARAGAASHADGIGCILVLEGESVGVDDALGVTHLAAERDRVLRGARGSAAPRFRDGTRDREISTAVRHFRELGQDLPWRLEGMMQVPDRAGAAEAREMQAVRAEALG